MNSTKTIGVWMDYSNAHIMEYSERPHEIAAIESKFESKLHSKEREKGEKYLQSLAKQCKADFFKKIASIILRYNNILLFGPTNAKDELFNMLCEDDRFYKIKIYLKETGRLTLNQRNRFIHQYFDGPLYESA